MTAKPILAIKAAFLAITALCAADRPQDEINAQRRALEPALRKILGSTGERLRPMQGSRVDIRPGGLYWYEAMVMLAKANQCRVYEQPPLYTCTWDGKGNEFFAKLVSDVEAVLGAEWRREDAVGGGSTRFERGEAKQTVEIFARAKPLRVVVNISGKPTL